MLELEYELLLALLSKKTSIGCQKTLRCDEPVLLAFLTSYFFKILEKADCLLAHKENIRHASKCLNYNVFSKSLMNTTKFFYLYLCLCHTIGIIIIRLSVCDSMCKSHFLALHSHHGFSSSMKGIVLCDVQMICLDFDGHWVKCQGHTVSTHLTQHDQKKIRENNRIQEGSLRYTKQYVASSFSSKLWALGLRFLVYKYP